MYRDYIRIAVRTFTSRRMRTFLTLLGIIIGIAAVVSLVSLGQGLDAEINEQFNKLGADKIFIVPGSSIFGTTDVELKDDDLKVAGRVNGVDIVTGFIYKFARVKSHDETINTFIIGMPEEKEESEMISEAFGVDLIDGRNLRPNDRSSAVLAFRYTKDDDLFDKEVKTGDKILVEGEKFKVVGRWSSVGNPQDDSNVYIPLDVARTLFDEPEKYDQIFIQVKEGVDPAKVAEEIKKDLRKHRDVDENEEDFTVQTTEQLLDTFSAITDIVSLVLIGIALISLFVGGVGIMNTMYTSVLERTSEIGVMKAIGARNSDIFLIFFIESGILGLVGGVIGVLFGVGLSKLVALGGSTAGIALIRAEYPPTLLIGALVFSFIVGGIAGTLPAVQASKLKPVDTLRYE